MSLALALGIGVPAGLALGTGTYGMFHPRAALFGPVISHGCMNHGTGVALTFDDGPSEDATPCVLDTLAQFGLKATFFVIGRHAVARPALLRRMHAEGHLVANHSFDHSRLGMFRHRDYWLEQLAATDQAIVSAIGERPRYFRPPMGFKSPYMAAAVRQREQVMVTWSLRAFDGMATTPQRIVARLLPRVRAGDIITMHDGREPSTTGSAMASARALGPLLEQLLARGLQPVRLDELIRQPAYAVGG